MLDVCWTFAGSCKNPVTEPVLFYLSAESKIKVTFLCHENSTDIFSFPEARRKRHDWFKLNWTEPNYCSPTGQFRSVQFSSVMSLWTRLYSSQPDVSIFLQRPRIQKQVHRAVCLLMSQLTLTLILTHRGMARLSWSEQLVTAVFIPQLRHLVLELQNLPTLDNYLSIRWMSSLSLSRVRGKYFRRARLGIFFLEFFSF